jgi:hypothetical protein
MIQEEEDEDDFFDADSGSFVESNEEDDFENSLEKNSNISFLDPDHAH